MTAVPLVVVAHGSRDPRSAATVRALVNVVRAAAPSVEARAAFLDLSAPSVSDVLTALHDEGHREVIVVPLLLGRAYHARVDLPGLLAEVGARTPRLRVRLADVLGPDPTLQAVALERLDLAGADRADARLGIVLAAVGSSHATANDAVAGIARRWETQLGRPVTAAFASTAEPDISAAVAALRDRGARRFAVASWFLAPGLLPDRVHGLAVRAAPGTPVAAPLGANRRIADVVLARYNAVRPGKHATLVARPRRAVSLAAPGGTSPTLARSA